MSASNVTTTFGAKSMSQQPPVLAATQSNSALNVEARRGSSPATPVPPQAAPRKDQGLKKQHKSQRRPGRTGPSRTFCLQEGEFERAEMAALKNASSRRGQTSITHLLSYTVAPSLSMLHRGLYQRVHGRGNTWGLGSGHHAIDKARYVHANYRFVVSPHGSYSAQASNADCHLDWADVLQVLASSESQATACPICLSDPVAPRMAKCGHVFCLPCLIRMMNSNLHGNDQKSVRGARCKNCPICDDLIYLHDVRPVHFIAGQECPLPRVGGDVILRLMARKSNSTLALPREGGVEGFGLDQDVPWHFAANVLDYARIAKGTDEYMIARYDDEIDALQLQEEEDENLYGEDGEWTQKAVKTILQAKYRLPGVKLYDGLAKAASTLPPRTRTEPDMFFFTAQPHLYLSPLDIRILKATFGSFSEFPSTLLPRVEHLSVGHVVDDALRKRFRYLSHLPQGCLITFLECDWTDIVPAETLGLFADEIEKRRKRNHEEAVHADRVQQQAERAEAAALHSAFGLTAGSTVPAIDGALTYSSGADPLDSSPNVDGAVGSTPPGPRPEFSHLASLSTSPSAPRTVWGTPAVQVSSDTVDAAASVSSPVVARDDDGWLRDEDVLGVAEVDFLAAEVGGSSRDGGGGGGGGGTGKRKKKHKITLMSNGGKRWT